MKNIIITLIGIFAFSLLQAQPSGWEVNSSDYEYSMTMSAQVEKNGTTYGADNDYLAAFVDGICRGVAQATWVESYEKYLFFLTIFSNEYSGEEVTFKYYDASNDEILEGFYPLTFVDGENLGNASQPYVISEEAPDALYMVNFSVTAEGQPVEGATININNMALTTNTSGEASIKLADGTYSYTVTGHNYGDYSGSVTVAGSSVNEEVILGNESYKLMFNVTCESGFIAGAQININGSTINTDAEGKAELSLGNGSYNYTISYSGYNNASGNVTISNSDEVKNVFLTLKPFQVTFNVKNEDSPVTNAVVNINNSTLTTDASGKASLELTNGTYDYTLTADGYEGASGSVTVDNDKVTEDVSLKQLIYAVSFTIDNGSDPVDSATIVIGDSLLVTDAEGFATVNLSDGEYIYTVTAEGYEDFVDTIIVSGTDMEKSISLSVVTTVVDIEENPEIKIYPNPAVDVVRIRTENRVSVKLINLQGQVMKKVERFTSGNQLKVGNINPGMYILYISDEERVIQKTKLIVK